MVERWFHSRPVADILCKVVLVVERHDMHVGRDVDVQHLEGVCLTQVVRHAHEAGGPRLGHAVVDYHQILIGAGHTGRPGTLLVQRGFS